jgi:hypothetical protein
MTDKRKLELFDSLVGWVLEHIWYGDDPRVAFEHLGFTEDEMDEILEGV